MTTSTKHLLVFALIAVSTASFLLSEISITSQDLQSAAAVAAVTTGSTLPAYSYASLPAKCYAIISIHETRNPLTAPVKYSIGSVQNTCEDINHLTYGNEYNPDSPLQISVQDAQKNILARYSYVSSRLINIDSDSPKIAGMKELTDGTLQVVVPAFTNAATFTVSDGTTSVNLPVPTDVLQGKRATELGMTAIPRSGLYVGQPYSISWSWKGDRDASWMTDPDGKPLVSLELRKSGVHVADLETGESSATLSGTLPDEMPVGSGYTLRLFAFGAPFIYVDSAPFTIQKFSGAFSAKNFSVDGLKKNISKASIAHMDITTSSAAALTDVVVSVSDQNGDGGDEIADFAPHQTQALNIPLFFTADASKSNPHTFSVKINDEIIGTFKTVINSAPEVKVTAFAPGKAAADTEIIITGNGFATTTEGLTTPFNIVDFISVSDPTYSARVAPAFSYDGTHITVKIPTLTIAGSYIIQVTNPVISDVSNKYGNIQISARDSAKPASGTSSLSPAGMITLNGSNFIQNTIYTVSLYPSGAVSVATSIPAMATSPTTLSMTLPCGFTPGQYIAKVQVTLPDKTIVMETFAILVQVRPCAIVPSTSPVSTPSSYPSASVRPAATLSPAPSVNTYRAPSYSPSPSSSPLPSYSPSPTSSPTPTPTPSVSSSPKASSTPVPSSTPKPSPTPTPSSSPHAEAHDRSSFLAAAGSLWNAFVTLFVPRASDILQ